MSSPFGITGPGRVVVREARKARRLPPSPIPEDAELNHLAAFALLRSLSDRQREALVLRYYANLPEAEAAVAMGVTRRASRRRTARALTAAREKGQCLGPGP